MENYIENLNWRYATKKFDAEKSLNHEDVEKLQKSIQLSASSYGLQPYEVFVISDKDTKEKLKVAAWNQSQLTDVLDSEQPTPHPIVKYIAMSLFKDV
jgi:nitroreductase